MTKQSYYHILTILVSIIILLVVSLVSLLMNPIIKTEIVEVPKEVIVEKEIEVIVEKEIPIETEVVIEKEIPIEIEVRPTYVYDVTSEEREMLARLVYQEANIESIECQKAIVSVVINRWLNGYWGDTLYDVIHAKNQFTPAKLLPRTTPNETNYQAVDYVLENGSTLPEYVLYFRMDYHFDWEGYEPYIQIDTTCFGYLEKDKK